MVPSFQLLFCDMKLVVNNTMNKIPLIFRYLNLFKFKFSNCFRLLNFFLFLNFEFNIHSSSIHLTIFYFSINICSLVIFCE